MPADWDDAAYLARYSDVAVAVEKGQFASGWEHFAQHGEKEGRLGGFTAGSGPTRTRGCLDPWRYLEITPTRGLKPCCLHQPIAQWQPGGATIEALRDSAPFRALRQDLLDGRLPPACRTCHIRPMVPVSQLRRLVERDVSSHGAGSALSPRPVRQLRLEITTECNLRCVYCAVSQPDYQGREMASGDFAEVLAWVATQPRDTEVFVNGHGETTIHPQWRSLCEALIGMGFRPSITTNLARPLDDAEARCLAGFRVVQISLDTVDPEQLRTLRRRTRLSTVVDNIEKIRATAAAAGTEPPGISLSCGVFDASYAGLEAVAAFAVEHAMRSVTFWRLVKYDDLTDAPNVYTVDSLDPARIADAVASLDRALGVLRRARMMSEVAGGFLDDWRRLASAASPAS